MRIPPKELGAVVEKLRDLLGGDISIELKAHSKNGISIVAVKTPEAEEFEEGHGSPVDLRHTERADYFG